MTHGLGRKMRLGLCTAVAILALSFMARATAEETFEERYARFQLFANCGPMDLYVSVSSEAEEIGLTATSVRAAAESRLRSSRLYDSDMSFYLSVTVNVVGAAFATSLEYSKYFEDIVSGTFGYATTWRNGFFETHGRESGYVLGAISQTMDIFLVEYLRVNEEACAKR